MSRIFFTPEPTMLLGRIPPLQPKEKLRGLTIVLESPCNMGCYLMVLVERARFPTEY